MKEGYEDAIDDKNKFTKKLYLAKIDQPLLPRGDTDFDALWKMVQQQSKRPPSYLTSQLTSEDDPIQEEIKIKAEAGTSKKKQAEKDI